ncbi:MAG TPA: STAS domain-containing protein [Acidimicrobiales bacterium]
MAPVHPPSVIVSGRGPNELVRHVAARTVVRIRGDQDDSNVAALAEAIAGAIETDDADLVVDLSEVQYMGVAAVRAVVRAGDLLRLRSRSLVLRSPPWSARRILGLCGHEDLLGPRPAGAPPTVGTAVRHRRDEPTERVAGRRRP